MVGTPGQARHMALASQLRLEERDLVMLVSQIDVPDLPEQLLADDRPVRREAIDLDDDQALHQLQGASLFAEHDLVLVRDDGESTLASGASPARIGALIGRSRVSGSGRIAPLGSGSVG